LGLVPHSVWSKGTVWQFVTYLFLHANVLHLFFNLYSLWVFGRDVENQWGRTAFCRYYLVTGIGAGVFHALVTPHSLVPTIGASGAVMGVLTAFAILFPDKDITLLLFFIFPVRMRAKTMALIFGGLSLFSGVMGSPDRIAHFAHLGGMLVGIIYLKKEFLFSFFRNRFIRRRWQNERKKKNEQAGIQETIDRILDKVNAVGMPNLSRSERRELKKASKRMRRIQ